MSIEVWIDQVSYDPCESVPSWFNYPDEDKENKIDRLEEEQTAKKRRRMSRGMEPGGEDIDATPRPPKRRRGGQDDIDPPEHFSPAPANSEDAASELESHHSGRLSPTKQLAYLEDSAEPVIYCDFASTTADVAEDVSTLCDAVQGLADNVGILGFKPDELADLIAPNKGLDARDRKRFGYAWANDYMERGKTGTMVSLEDVQSLVGSAISHEEKRSHETVWNEKVHQAVITAALATSTYVNIETKAPNKSWTDGKAQIAIWTAALFKRLMLLKQPGQDQPVGIPAMPLLIAQGHDWHFLVVSQQSDVSSKEKTTTIWQKIDIGSTRNCFDTYKLIAVLHRIMAWAIQDLIPLIGGLPLLFSPPHLCSPTSLKRTSASSLFQVLIDQRGNPLPIRNEKKYLGAQMDKNQRIAFGGGSLVSDNKSHGDEPDKLQHLDPSSRSSKKKFDLQHGLQGSQG
ncbi:MAG: hypothetical protein Q9220_006156 [cf. Caloplaca sp. 1 TL-2023]